MLAQCPCAVRTDWEEREAGSAVLDAKQVLNTTFGMLTIYDNETYMEIFTYSN